MSTSQRSGGSGAGPRQVAWTDRARRDLEAIADYIAADDPVAAERWIDMLSAAVARAAELPWSGRKVPEKGRDDIREVIQRRYRVVYRIREERIDVLTVFEGHRMFPDDVAGDG